jgi:solute:Na+ symporter, SSS family
MSFNVSEAAAYAVLYTVLGLFTLLALGSTGAFNFLPASLSRCFALGSDVDNQKMKTADYFLSARNSSSSISIALSFFASGMGAWVVYGTTEMGATPQLSWFGVLGYSMASACPALLITWLGPKVRSYTDEKDHGKAFATTDFGRQRYGRVMQVVIAFVSVFYMFIFIVAELTSISNVFGLLTNNFSESFSYSIAISLGVVTIFYTTMAGLPASILTDKFQGIIMASLVVILTIAVCAFPENRVTPEEFALASNWTTDGLMAAVTLFIAIACAELFNQGTWQRVWAAEDEKALRRGFFMGSGLVFLLMSFFGIMGMIAYANDPAAYDNGEKYAYLAFFDLLGPLANGWHIMVLILVTALAASSVDTLQNGITCIFNADLVKIGWNPKWINRALVVVVNIPAIYMASIKYDVISLFLVADLVCATSVFPVFLGLQTRDIWILKAPTELGAISGCIAGVVTVLINGVVNDADGGLFDYFWLKNDAICALCGSKTMVSFIITPLFSAFFTYLVSFLDILARGETRARMPLIPVAYDKHNETGEVEEHNDDDDKDVNDDVDARSLDVEKKLTSEMEIDTEKKLAEKNADVTSYDEDINV